MVQFTTKNLRHRQPGLLLCFGAEDFAPDHMCRKWDALRCL